MNQRGRRSSAALAVVTDQTGFVPIAPPPGLTDAERGVWVELVDSRPGDWFGTQHIPIMVEYARHVCRGHIIDEQIKGFDREWLATDEGLKRYETLIGLGLKTAGMVGKLATQMRLTHQSIYRGEKAGIGPPKGKKLWQREPDE